MLYLYSTEITIKETLLNSPRVQDQTGLSQLQRLEGLNSILTAIERWFEVFYEMPLTDWIGVTCVIFSQLGHCIMLLFKLTTLDEPGWDTDEVKKRADLVDMLERIAIRFDDIPSALGVADADSTGETGLFFKSSRLIRGLRALFLAELGTTSLQTNVQSNGSSVMAEFTGVSSVADDLAMNFADDPWLADIFESWWEL